MKICSNCNSEKNIIEHHISYDPEEKICLCRSCHTKEHFRLRSLEINLNKPTKSIRMSDNYWNDLKILGENEPSHLTRSQMICKLISDRIKRVKKTK